MRASSTVLAAVSLPVGIALGTGFTWTVQARQGSLPQFQTDPKRMEMKWIENLSGGIGSCCSATARVRRAGS